MALRMGRIPFLLVLCGITALLWLACAKLAVPPLIESVYRGESLPVLNPLIKGQSQFPVSHYLQKWDQITMDVVIGLLGFWLLVFMTTRPSYFRRFVGEATPGTLDIENAGNVGRVNIYRVPGLFMTVLGLIAGSILVAATIEPGPGFGAYLPWASALVQGTPAPLKSVTLSPTGFPLFHHYPGTGLVLALPTLLSGGAVNLEQSAKLAASTAIILALASFASLLYEIARKRLGLVLLGMSLLLVATNTGYYIRLLGAELFAFALVASAIWLAWMPKKIGNSELAGLSALASLLMTVRPQSIIMASPAMVLGLLRWAGGRHRPQLAWALLYFGVPIALGLLVVFQFNHWMTGEWTRSPLYFGNNQYTSVDLSARYIGLVLFDPRAGVLSCTPFIALGLCAPLVHILDRRLDKPYRAFYIVSLLAGLAQIWVISGFYGWAGGAWIFGSRYLNLLSLYGVISVVHVLASERIAWALKAVVLSATLACAAYTATLLKLPYLLGSLAVGATAAAWMAVSKTQPRHSVPDIAYGCLGLSLLLPILYYYAWLARAQVVAVLSSPALMLACIGAVVIVIAVYLLWMWSAFPSSSTAAKSVAMFSVFTLVIGFSLVARLRVGAAAFQARELASPSPQFLYKNRFHVRNLELDLEPEHETVYKWPEADEQALKIFLEEEKRRTAIRR